MFLSTVGCGVRRAGLRAFLVASVLAWVVSGCGGSGSAPAGSPTLTLSATSLNFGTDGLGTTTLAQVITVTNTGSATATFSAVTTTGDFSQTNTCLAGVLAGKTCQVEVTFTPVAVGARTGVLTLTDNVSGSPQTVTLSGVGGTPADTITPGSLAFGTVSTGSSSSVQTVTITSTGTAPLNISGIVTTGDFLRTSNTCTASLAVNASCQVGVMFVPTAVGARTGSLTVTTNSTGSPQVLALSGMGAAPVAFTGLPFKITALAGTQPIVGAAVQLFAAGSTGNGSAGTPLVSTLTTDVTGTVSVPAGYICPSAAQPLYAVASGGVVGTAPANANIVLVDAIGACNSIASGSKYVVDEATTVAAAYALNQFAGANSAFGSTGTNLLGLTNAFITAATLTDPAAGTSPGATLPAFTVSPAPRVNSLANLLNACTVSSPACASLYTATNTTTTTNTLQAMLNLVKAPATSTATIYTLAQKSTVYAPSLAAVPADWTMFLSISGGGLNSPSQLGVDSQGNVWVASYFYATSKFFPSGATPFPLAVTGNNLNNSYGLAIDVNDQIWVPNEQPFTGLGIGSVTVLANNGNGAATYYSGGLNYPLSVAIDPNGTTWVVDYGNSHVTLLNSLGTPLSGNEGYTTDLFAFPVAVAVDANHFGWIANQSGTTVTKVSPAGTSFTNYNCCNGASGIAIDQGNNVWVANFYGDSVSLISNTGTVVAAGTYNAAGGLYRPQGIAVDGAGNIFVANYRGAYFSEIAGVNSTVPGTSLSPKTGFGADASLLEAYGLAIDASGNVWISNQGNNSITKFIGMAVPVKTPLSGLPRLP